MRTLSSWTWASILLIAGTAQADKPYPRSIPFPPGCSEPVYSREKVVSRDGTTLVVHEWAPVKPGAGKPVVLFLHGIGMHGAAYASVVAAFTCHDLIFVVPDLRGHGRSGGVRGELAEAHVLRADTGAVIDRIHEKYPGHPVVLIGDSMGGLLAADYAWRGEKRLAGLVLLVPAFGVKLGEVNATSGVSSLLGRGTVAIGTRETLEPCTADRDFLEARLADKLALNNVRLSFLTQLLALQGEMLSAAREIKVPLYVGVAGKDRIVSNAVIERFYNVAGTPKDAKTWHRWDKAHHTIAWDPATREAFEDVAQWVLKRRPG